jgi:membrane protease YdiL (CAAX protease family)
MRNSAEDTSQDWTKRLALPFFLLTLAFTFVGFALFAASQADILPVVIPYEIAWMAQFGPTFIAIWLVWTRNGSDSCKQFINRLVRWRTEPKWYAVALLTAPALATVVLLINQILGLGTIEWAKFGSWANEMGAYLDMRIRGPQGPLQAIATYAQESPAWITVAIIVAFAITAGGLSEELGWRGYALSKLQQNYTPLVASIIIAIYWSVWHIAPPIWELLFTKGIGTFLTNAAITVGLYIVTTIPLSVLFVFVVNQSKASVLPAVLFHASYNLTIITITRFWPEQRFFWQIIILFWVVAMVVVALKRSHYLSLYEQNQPI